MCSQGLSEDRRSAIVWGNPARVTGKVLRDRVWIVHGLRYLKFALTHHCCVLGGLTEMAGLLDSFAPWSCKAR